MTSASQKPELESLFERVAKLVREERSLEETPNDIKLKLYGLYKHVVDGPCPGDRPPSFFHVVARSKYQAWDACRFYTPDTAMLEYVKTLASRDDRLGEQCQTLLQDFYSGTEIEPRGIPKEADRLPSPGCTKRVSNTRNVNPGEVLHYKEPSEEGSGSNHKSIFSLLASWVASVLCYLGVRPLIPRGRLDISYSDLFYALWQCIRWRFSVQRCQELSDQIRDLWKERTGHEVAIGLSVRSLFDLYLSSKKYPDECEVIVFPPISVPGMMHVANFHNLRIVPVDIEASAWWNWKGIQEAITKRTVAIMVVHPFGMISTTESQLKKLRQLADEHHLELWEDCAECFMGFGRECYLGDELADLRFFSFGMIKTATALGGGVAVFRDARVANEVQRMQDSLAKRQTLVEFLRKVFLSIVLNFTGDSPTRVGLLAALCSFCGLTFDAVVTSSIRGFQIANPPKDEGQRDRLIQTHLVRQIRKQPSQGLLSLMLRRFQQSLEIAPSLPARLSRCKHMDALLRKSLPDILLPNTVGLDHTYWSFPVSFQDRDRVSEKLHQMGFDVVSGASQLCCVSRFTNAEKCTRSEKVMNSVLYLPIASQHVSEEKMTQLLHALRSARDKTLTSRLLRHCSHNCIKSTNKSVNNSNLFLWLLGLLYGLICHFFGFSVLARVISWLLWTLLGSCTMTLLFLHLLRWQTADFYLEKSSSFAEHCDMVDVGTSDISFNSTRVNDGTLSRIDALQLPAGNGKDVDSTNKVLLTGATGFIGALLLRDLLFNRQKLSIGGGVIVICRGKGNVSAKSRITKLLSKPMFSFLSDDDKNELIEVLEGDVAKPFAGLSRNDLARIDRDLSISHVIHSAASVSFTQDLSDAATSNITSSLNMQTLTSRLPNKNAKFVHLSTAFVHGDRCGSTVSPLPEDLFSLGPFDASEIYKSMLGTQFYATKAMSELKFHNAYTFSKCICEHLLLQLNDPKTLIIRPSIVGPAVETPFEGWAGERPSTIVAGACLHLSHQWNIWYLEPRPVAYVPVDVLSQFILSKAFNDKSDQLISSCDTVNSSESSFEQIGQFSDISSETEEIDSTVSTATNDSRRRQIFNATWDITSNKKAEFSWLEFSVAYLHLGCVLGYFKRSTAYLALLIDAQLMPSLAPTNAFYDCLHTFLIRWPISMLISFCNFAGYSTHKLSKLGSFLDLPLLFFPFVKDTYHFQSDLVAPECFDAKRYVFSCGVAAHRFLEMLRSRESTGSTVESKEHRMSTLVVGGRMHEPVSSDLWWALSQPRGGYWIRFVAFLFIKILRSVCTVVSIDATSFRNVLSCMKRLEGENPVFLILAPTHRSFFDFVVLSYAFFAVPELQIDIPFIVAADEFEQLPVIGWLARLLRAIYIRRGRGHRDPSLTTKLASMKERKLATPGSCLEVFIEGKRSRDRRFVQPKTGFLKSLQNTEGEHFFLPITINYESIPEQRSLADEAAGADRRRLNIFGMLRWLKDVFRGKVNIGKIHIVACDPLLMKCKNHNDFKSFATSIQRKQQELVCISDYHIQAASKLFDVESSMMEKFMIHLGCKTWPQTIEGCGRAELSSSDSEFCTVVFQFGHLLAPLFYKDHRKWSLWLDHTIDFQDPKVAPALDQYTRPVYTKLLNFFTSADSVIVEAVSELRKSGFRKPKQSHVYQVAKNMNSGVPLPFLYAAVEMGVPREDLGNSNYSTPALVSQSKLPDSEEKLGFWGFHDSGFVVMADQYGNRVVSMKGSRYKLCAKPLTRLLPFIESEMQIRINPLIEFPMALPLCSKADECRFSNAEQALICDLFERSSFAQVDRIRHGTGHSQEDVYAIRSGESIRIPDAVVWPASEQDVERLVDLARRNAWCLIPFGGGTNVSNATRCPPEDVEKRPIISVDMKLMRRILWLNEEDGVAKVEAGITGRNLVEELERRGFTMGHEPDSIEFSTLGGWIATKASGMKRSKYGNIEDIVKSVRVIGSGGWLWKGAENDTTVHGRIAEGLDVCSLVMGSEGCLGIITSAVIRVWPFPERKEYDSVVLPSFKSGLQFARSVARLEKYAPSSVRILDNAHFRLGQALRPNDSSILHQVKQMLMKVASLAFCSFDPDSVVCATISYEGTKNEVIAQKKLIRQLAGRHGGMMLGSNVGKSGYELTFMIAYLRDFAMTYHLLGESFETFVPWSKIESLIGATKERIVSEHKSRLLPGIPFVGCRVTQLYHEGVCLYFYLCISFEGVENASEVFSELEKAARDEVLKEGGSLSHHHGVGKLRAPMLNGRSSVGFSDALSAIKKGIDSDNIFGARNGPFAFLSDKN